MKFEFTTTATPNTSVWYESNARLEHNLKELVNDTVSEDTGRTYCLDMFKALRTVNNEKHKEMLFLMYDEPTYIFIFTQIYQNRPEGRLYFFWCVLMAEECCSHKISSINKAHRICIR